MKSLTAVTLIAGVLIAPVVAAEPAAGSAGPTPGIRQSMEHFRFDTSSRDSSLSPARTARVNSSAQKASAALALGFIGMLGGGWIGSKVEGSCRCDDPGLEGAVIGVPVGAVLGGIIGWRLAR